MSSSKKLRADEPQDDLPTDVGSQLKRRRTLRGQSVEAVHQHTRIPKEHLEALEANDFDHFPAPVYLRGFLRSYAEYLDMDSEVLLAAADTARPPKTPGPKQLRPLGEAPAGRPFWLPVSESTLLPVVLLGGVLIAGGLLWALKERRPETPAPRKAVPAAASANAREVSVEITAEETEMIELAAQGSAVFEGRLPAGHTTSFKGRGFTLRSEHPERLRVTIDGDPAVWAELPDAPGGAKALTPRSP